MQVVLFAHDGVSTTSVYVCLTVPHGAHVARHGQVCRHLATELGRRKWSVKVDAPICGKKRPIELRILCRRCHDMAKESHHNRGSGLAA